MSVHIFANVLYHKLYESLQQFFKTTRNDMGKFLDKAKK